MVRVWYLLDDKTLDSVQVEDNAVVVDLRDAIKTKWGERLACAAPELEVFAAGANPNVDGPLRPDAITPPDTTPYDSPLIVKSPQRHHYSHVAFDLSFTVLRDNQQADGLRKLLTDCADEKSAFYPTNNTNTAIRTRKEMHDMAFKSLDIPNGADLCKWKGQTPRLLSVHLHFLTMEKTNDFMKRVLELVEQQRSTSMFDVKALSPLAEPEEGFCVQCIPQGMATQFTNFVSRRHYQAREQPGSSPKDSLEYCAQTSVSSSLPPGCVGNFDETDRLWPWHAIEQRDSFGAFAEKAHIFPHKECAKYEKKSEGRSRTKISTGYEWLDDPSNAEFNFLYVSKDMHAYFDGTGRGRASNDAAQPAICIEPEARTVQDASGVKKFELELNRTTGEYRATIPLKVWCKSDEIAEFISRKIEKKAELHEDETTGLSYFTNVSIQCAHRNIPMHQELLLEGDSRQRTVVYSRRVPFMDDRLSGAWSLNEDQLLTTEIMEKCLLWSANETWNNSWKNVVQSRTFASREG